MIYQRFVSYRQTRESGPQIIGTGVFSNGEIGVSSCVPEDKFQILEHVSALATMDPKLVFGFTDNGIETRRTMAIEV